MSTSQTNPSPTMPSKRNPPWSRDELLLALDLYFRLDPSEFSANHPEIVELSKLLRSLPINPSRPEPDKYRNANGVSMKLSNFLRFDSTYSGTGLSGGGKSEEKIWQEFFNDRERLAQLANAIKLSISEFVENNEILSADDDEAIEVPEGQVLLKLHKMRERNKALIKKKKLAVLKQKGTLICEVCMFDFKSVYGTLGDGFIECHHLRPISQMQPGEKTNIEQLALVCANCHRMLHRGGENMTLEDLKALVTAP